MSIQHWELFLFTPNSAGPLSAQRENLKPIESLLTRIFVNKDKSEDG